MKLTETAARLYNEIAKLTIVDAHEHLPPEKEYVGYGYSGMNFFAGYIWHDMTSAGMSDDIKKDMREPGFRPVSDWWPKIAPYWDLVKEGSYARAARITTRDLYGIEDIHAGTIEKLAKCIIEDNKPGLYRRILTDRCNIRAVLSCVQQINFNEDPKFKVVYALETWGSTADEFIELEKSEGIEVRDLDSLEKAFTARLFRLYHTGLVAGFKSRSFLHAPPQRHAAEAGFKDVLAGVSSDNITALNDYMFDKAMHVVAQMDIPVALHAGMWGDFRTLDPKFTIYLAMTYPKVRFDLFHLGMPMPRDAAVIGKNFPNVTLNLCWCPIISQSMTTRTLDELIDLVPVSKIIAFGGDYRVTVQKVWGHLVMAREAVASALAKRVEAHEMTEERALEIAKMWFHDNAARIYGI